MGEEDPQSLGLLKMSAPRGLAAGIPFLKLIFVFSPPFRPSLLAFAPLAPGEFGRLAMDLTSEHATTAERN